jgi:hypothetical protein
MTGYDRVVRWITDRFEGVEPGYRRDVAVTTQELAVEGTLWARSLELIALVGLALRLRSQCRTGNRSAAVWQQGTYLGGVLLVTALACAAWAHVPEPARGAGLPALATTLGAAAALSAGVGCALRRHRSAAVLLAATGGLGHVLATAPGAESAMFASAGVVAIGGLLIGTRLPAPAARRTALATSVLPLTAWPVALAAGPNATVSVIALVFTAIGPAAMVAPGWFDPRLAAAATTLVFSRLLAGGFDELGRALAVLAQDGRGALLARWALMSAGLLGAWFATRQSIRRMTHM